MANIELKYRPVTELIEAEYNPRQISDKQFGQLKDSLKRFGFVDPVLVNMHPDRLNIIIGGHMRCKAAAALGMTEVPTVELNLTAEQEKELNIRLNKSGGSWDMDALANYFETQDLIDWGFEPEEFGVITTEPAAEEGTPDLTPPKEPVTVLGDLYELNGHRVHCADSTDSDAVAKLMDGKKADMVFTDPPYNVGFKGQELSNTTQDGKQVLHHKGANTKHKKIENDDMPDLDFQDFMKAILANVSLFNKGAWYFSFCDLKLDLLLTPLKDSGFVWKSIIIWVKNQATLSGKDYKSRYEPIVYGCPEKCFFGERYEQEDVWEFQRTLKNDLHPTMKPVPLVENAIRNSSKDGMVILDLFLGSGTTLIAAEGINRICYGQELTPTYCDVIVRRWLTYMKDNNRPFTVKRNGQVLTEAELAEFDA